MAGLQGLRGVIKKIGRQDNLQMNIWDLDHMNKIVPPFLFNMHSQCRPVKVYCLGKSLQFASVLLLEHWLIHILQ